MSDDDRDDGWWLLAECRGLTVSERDDIFFPSRGDRTEPAKSICRVCPVREECLNYALTNGEKYGIWGGMSERERRRLRKVYRINGSVAS